MIGTDIMRRYRLTRQLFEQRQLRDMLFKSYHVFLELQGKLPARLRVTYRDEFVAEAKKILPAIKFLEQELSELGVST